MGRGASLVLLLALVGLGCSRDWYRRDADREVYGAIAERNGGPWELPRTDITPAPESRLANPVNPVCPPMPPDDPAAHAYMIEADGIPGYPFWTKNGIALSNENDIWFAALPREPDGRLLLDPERAVILGQIHSRNFQTELEGVYLSALSLTLNRFEFACQWYLLNDTFYTRFGNSSVPTETNTLTTNTNFGFSRALASGGQLLVNLANAMAFQYTGEDSFTVSSNLSTTLIKPLLRGAGRDFRMEGLVQGERDLLYAIREFARFRKLFYFNLTTRDGGYLGLLLLLQSIRNQEENVRRLEQIYDLHVFLNKSGLVTPVQVDQIFLSLKQAQATLLQTRTNLDNALDAYKFALGLPPSLPVRLDDRLLDPFQLNTPEMEKLQAELNEFDLALRQPDQAPPLAELKAAAQRLAGFHQRTLAGQKAIAADVATRLKEIPETEKQADLRQARLDLAEVAKRLTDLAGELSEFAKSLVQTESELREAERQAGWERLQRRTLELITLQADLLVYEAQVRSYGVELKRFPYSEEEAVAIALANRLDLMNEQARVVDAWRKIAVTANLLRPGLTVVGSMNLLTEPGTSNSFDFSAQASTYRVGVQLEAPLNRQIERNAFRASLIQYERSRRAYLGRADQVVQTLRRNLRQLETDRLNFEIARQSLIAAARQLEAARGRLLVAGDTNPATGTLDTLSALASLLQAKNTLIANWVNYETGRLQLLLDMEVLQLDERGIYQDESSFNLDPVEPTHR